MRSKINDSMLIEKMIDMYASNPNITHKEVCQKLKVSEKTAKKIRNDGFWNKVYNRFMSHHQHDVLQVINSAVKEAKMGNVSAQKLLLQHAGRLTNNISINNVKSPFDLFLESQGTFIDDDNIEVSLPFSSSGMNETDAISYEDQKKRRWLDRRKELYRWNKRAMAVNIPLMDAKRPTKTERQKWEASIVKAERLLKN